MGKIKKKSPNSRSIAIAIQTKLVAFWGPGLCVQRGLELPFVRCSELDSNFAGEKHRSFKATFQIKIVKD